MYEGGGRIYSGAVGMRPRKIDYDYLIGIKNRELAAEVIGSVSRIFITLGLAAGLVLCVWALAGQSTTAKFSLAADLKSNRGMADIVLALFGVSGCTYGYKERKLRQKNIARFSRQIKDLEYQLDPKRTSSNLTPLGTTRVED